MKYHLKFQNLHPKVVLMTKKFIKSRPYHNGEKKFKMWIDYASKIYGVKPPKLRFRKTAMDHYNPHSKTITMTKLSVTTLFHEFRHHLQHTGVIHLPNPTIGQYITGDNEMEHDARGWSLSLWHCAAPKLFAKKVAEGKILYIKPKDLED